MERAFSIKMLWVITIVTFILSAYLTFQYDRISLWTLYIIPGMTLLRIFPKWRTMFVYSFIMLTVEYLLHCLPYGGMQHIVNERGLHSSLNMLVLIVFTYLIIKNNRLQEELSRLAVKDALTNAYNRRYYDRYINTSDSNYSEGGLSVLALDIDHFKEVNDTYGHPFGDRILKEVSQLIRQVTRDPDVLIRMGGEEFAIILPTYQTDQAYIISERIRKSIELHSFKYDKKVIHITASIGAATLMNEESIDTLMKRADDALYKAKQMGRNQTITSMGESICYDNSI